MKQYIFPLFLLFFLMISGCTFLRGGEDLDPEDSYASEESLEEKGELVEDAELTEEEGDESYVEDDEEEEDDESYAEDDEEEDDDESYAEDDEEEDDDESYAEDDEEEESTGGLRGFFSRLFGFSDSEEGLDEELDEGLDEEEGLIGEEDADEEDHIFIGEDEDVKEDSRDYEDYEEAEYADYEEEDMEKETVSDDQDTSVQASESVATATPIQESLPKQAFIPLKKIISTPYKKAGHLVNAVYIARPNDTLESVSQKIYGMNQAGILRQINPHLQSRSVKVGDKIYYNSPQRKDDSSQLLFYYQDINAPHSVYALSPGDNIREVSSRLLGHPNSWKEIWATNPNLISKGEITGNITIFYWPMPIAVTMAQPPSEPAVEEKTPPIEEEQQETKQAEDTAPTPEEDFPPPPVMQDSQINQPQKSKIVNILQAVFKQKKMAAVLMGIIIILILMIRLIFKKRRQKDFDYTATDIKV